MRKVLWLCVLGLGACATSPSGEPAAQMPSKGAPTAVALPEAPRVALQRLQKACLDFAFPPTQIVYSEEPSFVTAHTKGKDGYQSVRLGSETPRPYRVDVVHLPVEPWDQLSAQATKMGFHGFIHSTTEARPLVHGMRTADGRQWLVTMVLFPYTSAALEFSAFMFAPMDADKPEEPIMMAQIVRVPIAFVPPLEGKALRLYGAQFDEKDASSFTIAYEVGGERGTLRWELQANPYPQLKAQVVNGLLKPG